MTKTNAETKDNRSLHKLIRKEIGSASNRRYLARIPALQAQAELPDSFKELLSKLDMAERRFAEK